MSDVTYTSKEVGRINDLLHMAQKRTADEKSYNARIISSLLMEIEKLVENGMIGEKEEKPTIECGECSKELRYQVIDGIYSVELCSSCQDKIAEEAVYQDRADTKDRIEQHRADVLAISRGIFA